MELIKKKICLEPFISRIPGMISTIDDADIDNLKNGSWGKIPKTIELWGVKIKYETLMKLYYSSLRIIINAKYYEYDESGRKWIQPDFDWRDAFAINPRISYAVTLPTNGRTDKMVVGLVSSEELDTFYNKISKTTGGNYNGLDLIIAVNKIIGRFIVPYACRCNNCGSTRYGLKIQKCKNCDSENLSTIQEPFVPYFLFWKDVQDWIDLLNKLKTHNCCEKKRYETYGGDAFLEYLTNLREEGFYVYEYNGEDKIPTIDIPILLTSKIRDLGQYRTYNVDEILEDGTEVLSNNKSKPETSIVKTSAESKFQTLRRRKRSVDDNGNELPFILNKKEDGTYTIETPYKVNYVRNLQLNNSKLYGDAIISMVETCVPIETNEKTFEALISKMPEDKYIVGTIDKPIAGIIKSDIKPDIIQYGSRDNHDITDVTSFFQADIHAREIQLRYELIALFKKLYPNILCIKQEFQFDYNLIYGIEDYENTFEDENGQTITPIKEESITKTHSGALYIKFDKPEIEITYVLGGRFKEQNQNIVLDEMNVFKIHEVTYDTWDGSGIWYRETFPIKKNCVSEFLIDNEMREFTYDVIDIESKMRTHSFPGIDFPRKNYILCEEVMYRSDAYYNDATHDPIFKDEKMLGLNYPLKESYNVLIKRGTSAAFERHIQLTELKTWQDLENYRNGMFLNK